jgi:hypothetical protein
MAPEDAACFIARSRSHDLVIYMTKSRNIFRCDATFLRRAFPHVFAAPSPPVRRNGSGENAVALGLPQDFLQEFARAITGDVRAPNFSGRAGLEASLRA